MTQTWKPISRLLDEIIARATDSYLANGGVISQCPKAKYALWPKTYNKNRAVNSGSVKQPDWLERSTREDFKEIFNGGEFGKEAGLHNA